MDKDNLNFNLQDWLNDPMLAAQLNRAQSSTPTIFNGMDDTANGSSVVQQKSDPTKTQLQSVDNASASELSNFLMNSRLNLGTLMKFVCIEFFKCNKDELANLRLLDLTQDSTFPQTLTLRNMQTENSHYKFFNTINRDKSITSCPVFAIALYSFITWKQTAISWKNFMNLPLIFDSKDIIMLQGNNQLRLPVYTSNMIRSTVTPKKEMLSFVFPWLPALERDYLNHDRSNYILFSIVELFYFLAKIVLQDFAFLQCTGQLPHLQELIKSELSWQFLESDDWNLFKDEMQRQIDNELLQMDCFNSVCGKIEDRFTKLSKDLVTENDKLSNELRTMKSQMASMTAVVNQIFHTQRQLLSYQIHNPANNITSTMANFNSQAMNSTNNVTNNENNNVNSNTMINTSNNTMIPTSNTNPNIAYSVNYSKMMNDKRHIYNQPMNSIKRMKLDGKDMSNFDSSSRRLSQPQPQSPLQIGSPLEALLSKPIPSPKITVSMLNNSVASPPPNPMAMSPLPYISEPIELNNNGNSISDGGQRNVNVEPSSSLNHVENASNVRSNAQTTSKINSLGSNEKDELRNGNDSENEPKVMTRNNSKGKRTGNPNMDIKYKLSRDNKTIWDLYNEWYHGLNGKLSIKELIEKYGYRRWKVTEDSHFFPTRRIIIDYIETETDRSINLKRFNLNSPLLKDRDAVRKHIVKDLETFREENGLTLNSLSLYFRNYTRWGKEICIYDNFKDWSLVTMNEEEKVKYCKRKTLSSKENRDDNYSQDDNE